MTTTARRIFKILGAILMIIVLFVIIIRYNTKAHSPEETVVYTNDDLRIEVYYNRPYKKNRRIFGGIVPYGKVWRTGANEATTFETNKDLLVDGSLLKAGKYSLWTIPMEESWKVIFNSKMYPWGINLEEEAYRDPKFDVLVLERPVNHLETPVEQFTIKFREQNDFIRMLLIWDEVSVILPFRQEFDQS